METRQQAELYSDVLNGAVVDWGSMGPGEEWVNSATQEEEQGLNQGTFNPSGEDSVKRKSYDDDLAPLAQNGENPTECGNTSPSGEDQWGQTSASHSDTWVMSSSWGMQLDSTERGHLTEGFLDSEPLREADEDMASEINLNNCLLTEEEREEIQQELAKKTSETISTAGQKTSVAFTTLGSAITRKFGDMRNSPSFKSFEEKVETTVSTLKTKVGGAETGGSFEEVLSSAANASSQDTPTNNLTDGSERP
ncbi:Tumor protein D53 like [Dissostichus eleginoides]|uniref:Tumor protein D53 like n=1 Tax=Dissostichus eleginoides TaxID=100907 RepID=A0AAD9BTG5_DISEL|nr:Tumor protein D53 like [Dissostichus eleginoides]